MAICPEMQDLRGTMPIVRILPASWIILAVRRTYRLLSVLDECTHECLAIRIGRKLKSLSLELAHLDWAKIPCGEEQ